MPSDSPSESPAFGKEVRITKELLRICFILQQALQGPYGGDAGLTFSGIKWINGELDKWINGELDKWINGELDNWINGESDKWINGELDNGING